MTTFIRSSPSGPISFASVDQSSDGVINGSIVPGATLTDTLDFIDTEISELELVTLTDDFLGGADGTATTPTEGLFGDLGWTFLSSGAGTLSRPTDQEYMGAYALMAPASARSGFTFAPANAQGGITLPSAQFNFLEFLCCPNIGDAAGGAFRFGLGMTYTESTMGQNGIFIEVNRTVTDNWRLVGRINTSINNVITSTIPFAPHTLTRVRIERNTTTGSWAGSINGTVFGALTSAQVSGTRMKAGCQVESGAGSAQSLAIDRFSMGLRAPLF